MLLMVERGVRGGICHSVYWCEKANSKNMKDYNKNKELSYIQYWDVSIFIWLCNQAKASTK